MNNAEVMRWLIAAATLVTVTLLTRLAIAFAPRHHLLDVPNARSSHTTPTPRAGGIAIVTGASLAFAALDFADGVISDPTLVALVGGIAVATIGFIDDRVKLTPWPRLALHFTASLGAVLWLGGLPPVPWGEQVIDLGVAGDLLAVGALVWVLNLFNFMDGIDGIAASEAVFICLAGAILGTGVGASPSAVTMALILGAAGLGFLVWNWPPARIFMGDAGSCYLGYVMGILALSMAHESPIALTVWLILGAAFLVDATVTLARRLVRGERVYEAHRTHAYQWLARRWGSHASVTFAYLLVNLCWLLPIAWAASRHPQLAPWCVVVAFVPLGVIALLAGAGRSEGGPGIR